MRLYKRCIDFLVPLQKSWGYGVTIYPEDAEIHVNLNRGLKIQVIMKEGRIVSILHVKTNSQDVTEAFQFAQDYQRAAFLMQQLQAFNPNQLLQSP